MERPGGRNPDPTPKRMAKPTQKTHLGADGVAGLVSLSHAGVGAGGAARKGDSSTHACAARCGRSHRTDGRCAQHLGDGQRSSVYAWVHEMGGRMVSCAYVPCLRVERARAIGHGHPSSMCRTTAHIEAHDGGDLRSWMSSVVQSNCTRTRVAGGD